MSPDILLYAIIAIVLLARLWTLFGHRNDGDAQRVNPFAAPAPERRDPDAAPYLPAAAAASGPNAKPQIFKNFALPPASLAGGLEQIASLYPAFNEKEFLQDARAAFTAIVSHFAAGDLVPIETRLGPEVLQRFKTAIAARKDAGQILACDIHAITDAEIIAARIEDKRAFITTRFVSVQTIRLSDASGSLIGSDTSSREKVTDDWVFMRDTALPDADWLLIEAKS